MLSCGCAYSTAVVLQLPQLTAVLEEAVQASIASIASLAMTALQAVATVIVAAIHAV